MDVLCFGQQNWDYCWTGKQHLTTRLAGRGHRVLYLDPTPVEQSLSIADTVRALAPVASGFCLREVAPRLYVFTHRHAPLLRWRINHWRRPRIIRRLIRRLGFRSPVALALHPDAESLVSALEPRATVYYAVDEMTAFGGMQAADQGRIRRQEERLLRHANVALAISRHLLNRLRRSHPRSYLLASASDTEHFAPERLAMAEGHAGIAPLARPRLGFVGQIDERLDQRLLVEISSARPHWQIVLAGRVKPGVDISALEALPNVHLLGYQPYEHLPSVLCEIDVCIVPYVLNELTQSCSPLKAYEYLATGLPVVSTPLEGLRTCGRVVTFAQTAESFVAAVDAALSDPDSGRQSRLEFAAANSWEQRTTELERRLREAVDVAHDPAARGEQPPRRRRSPSRMHRDPPDHPTRRASSTASRPARLPRYRECVSPAWQ